METLTQRTSRHLICTKQMIYFRSKSSMTRLPIVNVKSIEVTDHTATLGLTWCPVL